MKAAFTFSEAAHYLALRERTLEQLIKDGAICFRKRGKTILFIKAELDAWLHDLPGIKKQDLSPHSDICCDTPEAKSPGFSPHDFTPQEPIPLKRGPRGKKLLP